MKKKNCRHSIRRELVFLVVFLLVVHPSFVTLLPLVYRDSTDRGINPEELPTIFNTLIHTLVCASAVVFCSC